MIMGGVQKDQWSKYIGDVFRILKGGNGWAQCCESNLTDWHDESVPEDSPYFKVSNLNQLCC